MPHHGLQADPERIAGALAEIGHSRNGRNPAARGGRVSGLSSGQRVTRRDADGGRRPRPSHSPSSGAGHRHPSRRPSHGDDPSRDHGPSRRHVRDRNHRDRHRSRHGHDRRRSHPGHRVRAASRRALRRGRRAPLRDQWIARQRGPLRPPRPPVPKWRRGHRLTRERRISDPWSHLPGCSSNAARPHNSTFTQRQPEKHQESERVPHCDAARRKHWLAPHPARRYRR
jgi:hypothetical protein